MNLSRSNKSFHKKHLLPLAVSAAVGTSGLAVAQTLEEVVVTATKRQGRVMDVPLAITALSGNFIAATNLDDVKDLIVAFHEKYRKQYQAFQYLVWRARKLSEILFQRI